MIKSNLKELADSRGWSIRETALQMDYRFETVRLMYNGDLSRVPIDFIDAACRTFNCTPGDLMSYEQTKTPAQLAEVEKPPE